MRPLCRAITVSLALWSMLAADAAAQSGETGPIELQTVALPAPAEELQFGDAPYKLQKLRIRLAGDQWLRLSACDDGLCATEMRRGPAPERLRAGAVAGTRSAKGDQPLLEVWLADVAERAGTGVLPGPLAGALVGRDRKGRDHRLDLAIDRGIEAVAPRLADLDGDGMDEIVMTITAAGEGSVLSVLSFRQDGFAITWESRPADPGVWRDCVAIADVDGDQIPEIATVTAGDGVGRLEVWQRKGAAYELAWSLKGFASHVPGTRRTGIAAAGDMDGDGVADLVVPALDRRSLRVISFGGGQVAEPFRVALPAEIVTELGAYSLEGRTRPVLLVGLGDATIVLAR